MAYQIAWTDQASTDLQRVLHYLETSFGMAVADELLDKLEEKLWLIQADPYSSRPSAEVAGVYERLLTKHNLLLYQIKKDVIFLLTIFDTRQNPDKKFG